MLSRIAQRNGRRMASAFAQRSAAAVESKSVSVLRTLYSASSTRALISAPLDKSMMVRSFAAAAATGQVPPHGGKLINRMVTESEKKDIIAKCEGRKLELSDRNACDLELLSVGGFSPLEGFMDQDNYDYCVDNMRLKGSDLLFGLPVVLDTFSEELEPGMMVELTYKGQSLGAIEISDKWKPDKVKETKLCYGTSELEHPGTLFVATERGPYYLGGKVYGFEKPVREFVCDTPEEVRAMLPQGKDVVAFQCRNPVHRAHYELFTRAAKADNVGDGAVVLVHPTCGPTQGDDIPGDVRYKTYVVLKAEMNDPSVQWAYLPYSMHMAGPREAIQHMMIRKNYGCTHFIIGRDMAGSKSSITGEDYYGAYDAQDLANKYAEELGVKTVPSLNVVYTEEEGYVTADIAEKKGLHVKKLSGTKFRKMLRSGEDIPEWFAFKSVVKVLRDATSSN